jgi:hypothetical protein
MTMRQLLFLLVLIFGAPAWAAESGTKAARPDGEKDESRRGARSGAGAPAANSSESFPLAEGRLLVNLLMEGRLAWFSWMGEQRLKPKLVVEYSLDGKSVSKTYQHGLDGGLYPQAIYLRRGNQPGDVEWDSHAQIGATREGHKHHFFAKDSPPRVAFVKADISDIPRQALITKAQLILHIHNTEGLKQVEGADGSGQFRHLKKDWDWDHVTFTHYAKGKAWSTPQATYPYLGAEDVGPVLFTLHRQLDLAAKGYHKNGNRDYPLDLTDYVRSLQTARTR